MWKGTIKNVSKPATYPQFHILPCLVRHFREALHREFFVVVVHLCNSGFT